MTTETPTKKNMLLHLIKVLRVHAPLSLIMMLILLIFLSVNFLKFIQNQVG